MVLSCSAQSGSACSAISQNPTYAFLTVPSAGGRRATNEKYIFMFT